MKRNYHRAKALQSEQPARDRFFKKRDKWRRGQHWSVRVLNVSFVLGVVAAINYVALRLLVMGV